MTTRIHVVNFGPDVVEVSAMDKMLRQQLFTQQSADFYVYPGHEILVEELKKDGESPKG